MLITLALALALAVNPQRPNQTTNSTFTPNRRLSPVATDDEYPAIMPGPISTAHKRDIERRRAFVDEATDLSEIPRPLLDSFLKPATRALVRMLWPSFWTYRRRNIDAALGLIKEHNEEIKGVIEEHMRVYKIELGKGKGLEDLLTALPLYPRLWDGVSDREGVKEFEGNVGGGGRGWDGDP